MRAICVINLLVFAAVGGVCVTEGVPKITSGPGLGVMYGGVGVNVEYHMNERTSIAGGANPFSSDFRWTLAGLLHPDAGNRLRLSAGLTNTLDFFSGDDDRSTEPFLGLGWAPGRNENYRGWNFDIIFGNSERSVSVGYSF